MAKKKRIGLFRALRSRKLKRRNTKQRLMPEGYDMEYLHDELAVQKAAAQVTPVLAYVACYKPIEGCYTLVLAEDGTKGTMVVDSKFFEASSRVGMKIEVIPEQKTADCWLCRRELREPEQHKVGDVLLCKVLIHLAYGVILDIGGGNTGFLHITDMGVDVKHPSYVLKKGEYCHCIVTERECSEYKLRLWEDKE